MVGSWKSASEAVLKELQGKSILTERYSVRNSTGRGLILILLW